MLTVLNEGATLYRDLGDPDAAIPLYNKLLIELEADGMGGTVNIASAKINRAAAYVMKGETAAVKKDLESAQEILFTCLCKDPELLIGLGRNLASVYAQQGTVSYRAGDFAASEEMFGRAAELLKQYTGESEEYLICRENEKKARRAR